MIVQTFRVLLIEDELVTAKVTERILTRSTGGRFSVTIKATLADALLALTNDDFDITLLDLNLPDSNGLETLTKILETAPEVAAVVLTAADDDELGVRAVQLGAQDFLVKGSFNDTFLQRCILYSIERHRLQRTVRQLAVIDELTGLYNRRGFNSLHVDVLQHVNQGESNGYLVYFDLDWFKQINDKLGHAKGDEALTEFAVNLREIFRKDALLVRMGGDEFLAMGVEARAGQVDDTLQALEVVLSVRNMRDNIDYPLETSRGVATWGRDKPMSIEAILETADTALYQNKQERKRNSGPGASSLPFHLSA
jgi:diguanylate cyclase (GGDEF)-like protein